VFLGTLFFRRNSIIFFPPRRRRTAITYWVTFVAAGHVRLPKSIGSHQGFCIPVGGFFLLLFDHCFSNALYLTVVQVFRYYLRFADLLYAPAVRFRPETQTDRCCRRSVIIFCYRDICAWYTVVSLDLCEFDTHVDCSPQSNSFSLSADWCTKHHRSDVFLLILYNLYFIIISFIGYNFGACHIIIIYFKLII